VREGGRRKEAHHKSKEKPFLEKYGMTFHQAVYFSRFVNLSNTALKLNAVWVLN
jgi:hypothetical protein